MIKHFYTPALLAVSGSHQCHCSLFSACCATTNCYKEAATAQTEWEHLQGQRFHTFSCQFCQHFTALTVKMVFLRFKWNFLFFLLWNSVSTSRVLSIEKTQTCGSGTRGSQRKLLEEWNTSLLGKS